MAIAAVIVLMVFVEGYPDVFIELAGYVKIVIKGFAQNMTGISGSQLIQYIISLGIYSIVICVFFIIIMCLVKKILMTVKKENTPFVKKNISRIKIISILIAALSVVPQWAGAVASLLSASATISVEISMLVIALVVWCIALMFEYGYYLQKNEDETL